MKRLATLTASPATNTAGGAHTAGDALTAKFTLDLSGLRVRAGGAVSLVGVVVSDLAGQDHDMDLVIFNADPSATTITANTALDVADADLTKIIAVINVDNYAVFADNGIAFTGDALDVPISIDMTAAAPTLHACLVTRGTPTQAGTADITVRVTFEVEE